MLTSDVGIAEFLDVGLIDFPDVVTNLNIEFINAQQVSFAGGDVRFSFGFLS